uniref:Mitochondrial outer membrane protein porin of 34 kDa n=1 Tax=Tanacetum cinerariifolium TaxID=118510 RepID=A0A6L2K4J8_TANCI|nr:mitochondrial outer membrane protein porin of 34 kDa [Tanacetum cinerariifolium]
MVKGPGLYTDIGKRARDLLYRDYQSDHKFTVTTFSPTGVMILYHFERFCWLRAQYALCNLSRKLDLTSMWHYYMSMKIR